MVAKKKNKQVKKKKKTAVKKKRKVSAVAKPKIVKNYVMMVLDESGSMESIKKQAIDAFNEQIQTVKNVKDTIEVAVSLVAFANEARVVFDNTKIDQVSELTTETYTPNGSTAMFDGVGKALELLKKQPDINKEGTTVLVLVISDGEENASRIYNSEKIAAMVADLQATGRWTFTYAGANQDLAKISKSLNIPLGNMSTFQATAGGMSANTQTRTKSTRDLYASYSIGTQSVSNFYDQTKIKTKDEDDDSTTP